MVEFLSGAWIESLDRAAGESASLAELCKGIDLVVEQHVTGPEGDITYHVTFADGHVSVHNGPADSPTLRFSQELGTAIEIASGASSAQRAFMTGRLRLGGDLTVLLAHGDLLSGLDDAFADVRARTEMPALGDSRA